MSDTPPHKESAPELGVNKSDITAALVRSSVGIIPFAGPVLSEIITYLIPNQRIDRIVDYLNRLDKKLSHISQDDLRNTATSPEGIDLFEDGAFQASRAVSNERREYIARVVAFGLTGNEQSVIEAKQVIKVLDQLDDRQIIILAAHHDEFLFDDEFHKTHEKTLVAPFAHMQSDQSDIDKNALHELAKAQLFNLGLLKERFNKPKTKGAIEMDPTTGMLKSSGTDITSLGRLIIRRIGLADNDSGSI